VDVVVGGLSTCGEGVGAMGAVQVGVGCRGGPWAARYRGWGGGGRGGQRRCAALVVGSCSGWVSVRGERAWGAGVGGGQQVRALVVVSHLGVQGWGGCACRWPWGQSVVKSLSRSVAAVLRGGGAAGPLAGLSTGGTGWRRYPLGSGGGQCGWGRGGWRGGGALAWRRVLGGGAGRGMDAWVGEAFAPRAGWGGGGRRRSGQLFACIGGGFDLML